MLRPRPWTELSDIRGRIENSFEQKIEVLDEVTKIFESLGIQIKSSRIASYRRALLDLKSRAEKDQRLSLPAAMALLSTSVEVQELRTIAKASRLFPNLAPWRNHLEKMVSGSHAGTPSKAASSAWDFQYEAYIASVALLSGYDVSFDEPDVIIRDGSVAFGIAAKRPRTQASIKRNLERASAQIRTTGTQGIIALDCSVIAADGKTITTASEDAATSKAKDLCDQVLNDSLPHIKSLIGKPNILGVLVSVHIPVTIVDEQWQRAISFMSAFRWTMVPLMPFGPNFDLVMNFAKRCEVGLFETQPVARISGA